jgi:hypothetical protein
LCIISPAENVLANGRPFGGIGESRKFHTHPFSCGLIGNMSKIPFFLNKTLQKTILQSFVIYGIIFVTYSEGGTKWNSGQPHTPPLCFPL